ncbi:MAG TPA: arginine--tRNA ligase [Bacteroidota bacterium]|nr:arginine--tRNA ligase [Bacteroidota bacterium]
MKDYLREKVRASLQALGITQDLPIIFEKPRQPEHGDLTTNIAMMLAKQVGRNPRQLATDIVRHLDADPALLHTPETAGPGFINFRFTRTYFHRELAALLSASDTFGRSNVGGGKKTQVEFVSANPTGPLTVGHGRNAVFGDTIATLLEWTGHDVTREYYFNNAGRQMRMLGDSVRLRYLELLGDQVTFPEDYYQGEYIREIAQHLKEQRGDALRNEPAEGAFKEQAEQEIFADIRQTLKRLGIEFRSFFNENTLYESGLIREVIDAFKARDLAYESEGALWLKAAIIGGEKDKVIVKSSGEPTYRLPDIAYHIEKFRRGYELMVDVFGSDHIATYPDVLGGLKALGYDISRVKVLIHQFVTILQNGEVVKMSTRKANYITLDELVDEVGSDVVRYFFLMRSIASHLNFDLTLAKQQSDENPVYYLQYAHARIASILRYAGKEGAQRNKDVRFELLQASEEMELIRLLLTFPEVVESCASSFEPHRLAEYLHAVAGAFHKFYHHHRVVGDDADLTRARLALCDAVKAVLRNGLTIFGITAPEQM